MAGGRPCGEIARTAKGWFQAVWWVRRCGWKGWEESVLLLCWSWRGSSEQAPHSLVEWRFILILCFLAFFLPSCLLVFLSSSCIWSFLLQYECYHCYSKATIWTVSHEQMHVINVCDILWWNVFSCLISKNFRAVWPCFFNLNLVLKIIFLSSKTKNYFWMFIKKVFENCFSKYIFFFKKLVWIRYF